MKLLLTLLSFSCLGMDQRFFFENQKIQAQVKPPYKFEVETSYYGIDLTHDGQDEFFKVQKKDGEDWLEFYDDHKNKVKNLKLNAQGSNSRLHRVSYYRLSSEAQVLVLFFQKGQTKSLNFNSSFQLYFVSIDKDQLGTLTLKAGPVVAYESYDFLFDHYAFRKAYFSVEDLNQDNIRDIVIRSPRTSQAYLYLGGGQWKLF